MKDPNLRQIGSEMRKLVHNLNNKMEVIIGRTELALYTGKGCREVLEEVLKVSKDALALLERLGQLGRELSGQGG